MQNQPTVLLFGGCNGAGKTTLAFRLLGNGLKLHEFVNADEIARGLNPLNPYSQTGLASRLAIQRVEYLISERHSFSFEGTLSGKWQAKILKRCKALGYHTSLIYVWLPSYTMAIDRVAQRVKEGGHHVEDDLVKRRHKLGLMNLQELYLPIVDDAIILKGFNFENDLHHGVIAKKHREQFTLVQPDLWSLLCSPTPL